MIVWLALLLLSANAVVVDAAVICSAWTTGRRGCREFDVGDLSGKFDVQSCTSNVFLYTQFATVHLPLLSHFVEHYVALGIERRCFLLVWNYVPDITTAGLVNATNLLFERLAIRAIRWTGVFTSAAAHYNKIELLGDLQESQWVVYADIDEFLDLQEGVRARVEYLESKRYTHENGCTVDRVASNGRLVSIRSDAPITEQYPLRCNLTESHGLASKVVFLRGDLRTVSGNHRVHSDVLYQRNAQRAPSRGVQRKASPYSLVLDHYKWTPDVVPYLQQRVALYKKVRQHWALSAALLESLKRNNWTVDANRYCRSPNGFS